MSTHPGPRCAEIFDLATNHGLPCDDGDPRLAERVAAFIEDYRVWVPTRDAEVERFLRETRSRYRLFLPNTPWTPTTAGEMYWYFDDLIVYDAFSTFIYQIPLIEHFEICDPETRKWVTTSNLQAPSFSSWARSVNTQLLEWLPLRGAMLGEAILVLSAHVFDADQFDFGPLVDDSELRRALTKNYQCSSRLDVKYGDIFDAKGHTVPGASLWIYRRIDNGSGSFVVYPSTAPKIPALGKANARFPLEADRYNSKPRGEIPPSFEEGVRKVVLHDLARQAQLAATAQLHHGAVLSERDTDLLMMTKLFGETSVAMDAAQRNSRSFELALPHLQGLSPQQLFDLRGALPDAFESFRAQLAEYCLDSRSVEHAHSKAEELTRAEKELQASLRAKLTSNRILGYGAGAVGAVSMLLGALGMTFLGPTLPLLGAGGLLASAARSHQAERALKASPACFIWNARRKAAESR